MDYQSSEGHNVVQYMQWGSSHHSLMLWSSRWSLCESFNKWEDSSCRCCQIGELHFEGWKESLLMSPPWISISQIASHRPRRSLFSVGSSYVEPAFQKVLCLGAKSVIFFPTFFHILCKITVRNTGLPIDGWLSWCLQRFGSRCRLQLSVWEDNIVETFTSTALTFLFKYPLF